MFEMLNEDNAQVPSRMPRWARRLIQLGVVVLATGSVFGVLYLGMIMMD